MIEPAEQPVPSPISETEIDLTVIEALDRHVTVTVVYRTMNEDGAAIDFVDSQAKRFPIRGSLPVPTMTSFLRMEARINDALAATPESDKEQAASDRALEAAMEEAHARIVGLIIERTPSAFHVEEREIEGQLVKVRPAIELDTSQILVLLGWIAGDISVADAVARGLTAGQSPARSEADVAAGRGGAEESEAVAPAAPFDSTTP